MNKETIESHIRSCIEEAQKATEEGNTPYGCVITNLRGEVVVKGRNKVITSTNPSLHAEITAIAKLCEVTGGFDLSEYVLFANAESCPMCMSCALRTGIGFFYFGAQAGGSTNPKISVQQLADQASQDVKIETGILKEECSKQIVSGYAHLAPTPP